MRINLDKYSRHNVIYSAAVEKCNCVHVILVDCMMA
jgi:hypothetical protein